MNSKQLVKILQQNGWQLKDQKGSHQQFIHPVKQGKVTVAFHGTKDIAPGTLRAILKQAGIKL